jgi:N-acetylneuraminate synthase
MKAGDVFTELNIRSIRPSNGLHTRYYEEILGKTAAQDIEAGTALSWELVK